MGESSRESSRAGESSRVGESILELTGPVFRHDPNRFGETSRVGESSRVRHRVELASRVGESSRVGSKIESSWRVESASRVELASRVEWASRVDALWRIGISEPRCAVKSGLLPRSGSAWVEYVHRSALARAASFPRLGPASPKRARCAQLALLAEVGAAPGRAWFMNARCAAGETKGHCRRRRSHLSSTTIAGHRRRRRATSAARLRRARKTVDEWIRVYFAWPARAPGLQKKQPRGRSAARSGRAGALGKRSVGRSSDARLRGAR
eukprot:9473284-Pyramimonas_sp.AAC.2